MRLLKLIPLLPFGLAALTTTGANLAASADPHREIVISGPRYVIGISPFLEDRVKDDIYRGLVRLVVEDLPLGSSLVVYDAFNLKSVASVALPTAKVFNSPKTRANQFASPIGQLKQFLAKPPPKPKHDRLDFNGAVRLPQFCDFLAENLPPANSPTALLIIGSPLYQDAKEPTFSMVEGYFPSDGHLQATREQSVYGSAGERDRNAGLIAHWAYFGDPWLNDLHQEKISRFWTLYLERRGAQLATFCADLPTALKAFREAATVPPAVSKRWAVDSRDTKIEMLRVGRSVQLADWLTRDTLPDQPQRPPSVMVGPMKIGIRWKHNIDLDLYATPRPGAETLFFQHLRSPEGYYYKDHRSSPGREYEFIEFETPIDLRQVEAFVNFYEGTCEPGPGGEVRIEFDGRIYSAPFAIEATTGNRGRSSPTQQRFWTRIPVQQILKIPLSPEHASR